MNLNFTDLLAKVSSWKYGERLRPLRDWTALLSIFAVLLLVSVAWNILIFLQVINGDVLGGKPSTSPPVFDRASVESVQTLFTKRSSEELKYTSGTYRFVDPSQ